MYRIGNMFKTDRNCDTYMLCQSESTKVALINLRNGNRWGTCCYVDDLFRISQKEFDRIAENIFNTDTWSKIEPVENIETKVSVMNTFSPETHMTRGGHELLQLTYFPDTDEWVGVVKGLESDGVVVWNKNGELINNEKTVLDLVKKKVKKSGWVGIYKEGVGYTTTIHVYDTEDEIKEKIPSAISYQYIEWEVE